MVTSDKLVALDLKALSNAHELLEKLGDKGLNAEQKNSFGDIPLDLPTHQSEDCHCKTY